MPTFFKQVGNRVVNFVMNINVNNRAVYKTLSTSLAFGSRKSILKMSSIKGWTPLYGFLPAFPSRQAIRESAHWAASGVFHPDAAQQAPVPVPLGARLSLSVSDAKQK